MADDTKRLRLFIRSSEITDGVWWYCGGPDLSQAINGFSNYTANFAESQARDTPGDLQKLIDGIELEVRQMTDAEVESLPDV